MQDKGTNNIKIAFFLNLGFTIVEFIAGFLTNSIAIYSNALHDLGDNFSLGLSWFLDRISHREKSARFSYGYRRFSLLGALMNALILVVGSIFILSEAIPRLFNPDHLNVRGMMVFAVLGIIVNGMAALRLKTGHSMNEQVVTWHLLEDVLGWAAVLLAAIILLFWNLPFLDPALSILLTGYILFNVVRKLIKTLLLFLQGVPDKVVLKDIEQKLNSIKNVLSTHHIHVWSLDGEHHVLTCHVVVGAESDKEAITSLKSGIINILEPLNFEHTTIEVEYEDEDCRNPR
jgi:cobalt-zinc-cadmium efflux system protein